MSTDVQNNSNQPYREKECQDPTPNDSLETARKSPSKSRKMVRSKLMGDHTHETRVGVNVHIYERDGKYLARGRFERRPFGETLGTDPQEAKSKLRELLHRLDSGTFVPPSDARKQILKTRRIPNLTLRELCDRFLIEKRKVCGEQTARTYYNRLSPYLDFSELARSLKRWPTALSLDRDFALESLEYLFNRKITRNGSANAPTKLMSSRHIKHCGDTLRMALNWACRADVRNLPPDFVNPITHELFEKSFSKDPLRDCVFPLERRIKLLKAMDDWQFMSLSILLVLPIRLEDVAGLLVSDVDFEKQQVHFGTRLGGSDFNKGKVDVQFPLPDELMPLLQTLVGERVEGPLFLNRKTCQGKTSRKYTFNSTPDLEQQYQDELAKLPKGKVRNSQDRKAAFRDFLNKAGGVTSAYVGKQLRQVIGKDEPGKPYDLRGSITQEMKEAGIPLLELRYLTEHTVNDIINVYSPLNPKQEIVKYYNKISPLLDAIKTRTEQLVTSKISACQSRSNPVQDTLPEGGQNV
ncbi:phage integrase family protein [Gimesia benthica]|uniref:Phage integrase family protein n=1 Tax=Gimesia benthica TaxID=2608982 RepID=A0A6I6AKJ2_9PLAN|nr:tyrosine-type recombinase/integrase [Gimesia benthica]QGQ25601.1 phage integrase family protein [Gimesia benthica]